MPALSRTAYLFIYLFAAMLLSACGSSRSDLNPPSPEQRAAQTEDNTYDEETVLNAAGGVFGDGAEGLAKAIEGIFSDLGRPNGYIVGEEAGGGFIGALRYGAGTLHHKIEGVSEVHWTGPSIGFEAGGNVAKAFTLVYNLYDTGDLLQRYPSVEGQFYFVGGLGINYHQSGDVIIVPIRLGVGLRATANIGYIKYTEDRTFNPF